MMHLGLEAVRQTIKDAAREDDEAFGRSGVSLPQDPKAAGKYTIEDLSRALAGYVFNSSPESGDKYRRSTPVASQVNVGNVSIVKGPYLKAFEDEMELFPNAKKDDQIDALSRAFANVAIRPKLVRRRWANSDHMAR
ncbi:phage terminase large subunit [Brevundimonas sp.]|uniref:phage terminase large subunit n=1 Tax=Brevundimonas sp. TaxID=1871086 RepID=UPI00289B9205|nr:phage terminase large subunit [Brevundimonas sp.]